MLRRVAQDKKKMLTVKMSPTLLRHFHLAADLKDSSASNLVRMYARRIVEEQKQLHPEEFKKADAVVHPVIRIKHKEPKLKARQAKG